MQFTMTINMDNDAFRLRERAELTRILRKVEDRLQHNLCINEGDQKILDVNGNTVGRWGITDDPF